MTPPDVRLSGNRWQVVTHGPFDRALWAALAAIPGGTCKPDLRSRTFPLAALDALRAIWPAFPHCGDAAEQLEMVL